MIFLEMNRTTNNLLSNVSLFSDVEDCDIIQSSYVGPEETFQVLGEDNTKQEIH